MSGGGYAQAPNAQKQDSAAAPKQESAGAPKQEQQQQPSAPVQNRQLVQTARIQMTVQDPVAAVMAARGVATSLSGFTGQEESSGDNATITLRVPADKFDSALDQLAKLGKITTQHKQADDVTAWPPSVPASTGCGRCSRKPTVSAKWPRSSPN
jgi:hypothetical protein